MRLIASRDAGEGKRYVRVSAFIFPCAVAVPVGTRGGNGQLDGFEVHTYIPIDDTHSWRFDFGFKRTRAVTDKDVHRRLVIGPNFRRIPNWQNHYLQDREMQRTKNFTGMTDFLTHDSCATESMGALFDRSQEHLGLSDKAVIAVRRQLLDQVKHFQDTGEAPYLVTDPELNVMDHAESTYDVFAGDWHAHWPHLTTSVEDLIAKREPAAAR
jgi:hypothetical protein